jgi:hypothetical protein
MLVAAGCLSGGDADSPPGVADFDTCMREGSAALEAGRFATAASYFERAARLDARTPAPFKGLYRSLRADGRSGRANRVLVEAFDRWPDDPELRAWMEGMHLQGEGRPGNSGSSK